MRAKRTTSSLVLAGVLALGVAGCGDQGDPGGESGDEDMTEEMTDQEMTDDMTEEEMTEG